MHGLESTSQPKLTNLNEQQPSPTPTLHRRFLPDFLLSFSPSISTSSIHLHRRHRVILFSLSLFHFDLANTVPSLLWVTITLLRLALFQSIRLLDPTPFSTLRSTPFRPTYSSLPARYSESFTITLISTLNSFGFYRFYHFESRLITHATANTTLLRLFYDQYIPGIVRNIKGH